MRNIIYLQSNFSLKFTQQIIFLTFNAIYRWHSKVNITTWYNLLFSSPLLSLSILFSHFLCSILSLQFLLPQKYFYFGKIYLSLKERKWWMETERKEKNKTSWICDDVLEEAQVSRRNLFQAFRKRLELSRSRFF